MPSMTSRALFALLACAALSAQAQPKGQPQRNATLSAAGMLPGQSPQVAAGAFAAAIDPWEAEFGDKTLTDALANDCEAKAPGSRLWTCQAQPEIQGFYAPASAWVVAQYGASRAKAKLGSRYLGRAKAIFLWTQGPQGAWEQALAQREAPTRQGKLSAKAGLQAFADFPEAAKALQKAKSFQGARWVGPNPAGQPVESAAVAALDAQGGLLGLAVEANLADWPALAKAASKPEPLKAKL